MERMVKVIIVILLLTCGVLAQQKPVPRFEDYPVKESFVGKPAPVKLNSDVARAYRTRLRENAAKGVNFAGHYIAATWGCGSACAALAIIDARTGKVYISDALWEVSGYGYSAHIIQFRKDSRLIIAEGQINDEGYVGRYYFVWRNNRLKLIRADEDREWRP